MTTTQRPSPRPAAAPWEADLRRLAAAQSGRIHTAQLRRIGMPRGTVNAWIRRGHLIRRLPHVLALGYVDDDRRGRLWELILYAGPQAALTGGAAAHLLGCLNHPTDATWLSTPRSHRRPVPGARILCGRSDQRRPHPGGLPVTTTTQMLLDLATETRDLRLVRKAMAGLDFRRELDRASLVRALGQGRAGSRLLRAALERHLPQLARTRSPLEDDFLILLDDHRLPLPEVNVMVHGHEVDTFWPRLGLIVEIDGDGNHGTPAQRRRDAARDSALAGHRLTVLRLDDEDVRRTPAATLRRLAGHGVVRPRR